MRKLIHSVLATAVVTISAITPAFAEATQHTSEHHHPSGASGFLSMLPMLIIFVALFYFLLVRPQQKRAKQQKELMGQLGEGDEVITTAGIIGKIKKLSDGYVTLEISNGVELTLQKQAVTTTLPKGTMDSI